MLSGTSGPAVDLVLTDLMLPGHDGLHLVTELRRLDPTARLPLIVLTARGGAEAIAQGMVAGADDYITKPFASQELLARLRANHELHQRASGPSTPPTSERRRFAVGCNPTGSSAPPSAF